jgi:pimeloyl-ACP methyl ester carboxylesterase
VLLVWGRHDPFSGVDYAERLARLLPDARVAVIEAAAHHPQSERPAVVRAAVTSFLREADATRARPVPDESRGEA